MTTPQPELEKLERWIAERDQTVVRIEPIVGDVSARRYFRVFAENSSSILAFYPPSLAESCERFLKTSDLLEGAGVRVPRILASDPSAGLVWLEDLGSEALYDHRGRPWSELLPYFSQALEQQLRILSLDRPTIDALNPRLDGIWLDQELDLPYRTLLVPFRFFSSSDEEQSFRDFLSHLCLELGHAPSAPCHRDFMARNLLLQGERLAVIDHQDLRIGPRAYDLASLLNDSLFPPREIEERLLETRIHSQGDRRHYHLAAIQRTLKAAGTFASFAQRGHPRHIPLIAPSLRRTLAHLYQLPDGKSWALSLGGRWQEVLETSFASAHLEP